MGPLCGECWNGKLPSSSQARIELGQGKSKEEELAKRLAKRDTNVNAGDSHRNASDGSVNAVDGKGNGFDGRDNGAAAFGGAIDHRVKPVDTTANGGDARVNPTDNKVSHIAKKEREHSCPRKTDQLTKG